MLLVTLGFIQGTIPSPAVSLFDALPWMSFTLCISCRAQWHGACVLCMLNVAVVPQGTFPEPLQPAANSVVCTSADDTSLLRAVFNKTAHVEHPISFPPSRCRTAISRCQQCLAKAHCRHQRGLCLRNNYNNNNSSSCVVVVTTFYVLNLLIWAASKIQQKYDLAWMLSETALQGPACSIACSQIFVHNGDDAWL